MENLDNSSSRRPDTEACSVNAGACSDQKTCWEGLCVRSHGGLHQEDSYTAGAVAPIYSANFW